jgi:hypothetical protein
MNIFEWNNEKGYQIEELLYKNGFVTELDVIKIFGLDKSERKKLRKIFFEKEKK